MKKPEDKMQFVDEVLSGLRKHMAERVGRMPMEWDGIELRRYMTDYFRLYVDMPSRMTGNTRRALDYRKTLVSQNLL